MNVDGIYTIYYLLQRYQDFQWANKMWFTDIKHMSGYIKMRVDNNVISWLELGGEDGKV